MFGLLTSFGCSGAGPTPRDELRKAIDSGTTDSVRRLLREHPELARPSEGEDGRFVPLVEAALAGDAGVVALLLGAGAPVEQRSDYGVTALQQAAVCGSVTVIEVLLRSGADVKARDTRGYTALHHAAAEGRYDAARLLVKAGAEPNAQLPRGDWTPLFLACMLPGRMGLEFVELLVAAGAAVNEAKWPDSPLRVAAVYNRRRIVRYLLAKGGDVNRASTLADSTLLHSAAGRLRAGMCWYLITHGADVDWQDSKGNTPLMAVFVAKQHTAELAFQVDETVACLLDGDPDLAKKNNEGQTALQLAQDYGFFQSAVLINRAATTAMRFGSPMRR